MKNILIILLLVGIVLGSDVFIDKNVVVKENLFYDKKGKLITGKIESYYKNGKLKQLISIKNGKYDGQMNSYYENGNFMYIHNYKNDILNGLLKTFRQDGTLESEVNIINGKREGILKTYYRDGRISTNILFQNNIVKKGFMISKEGKKSNLNIKQLRQIYQ